MNVERGDFGSLKFMPFSSQVNVEFWDELTTRKLDQYRLSDEAQPICGFYGHDTRASCRLTLLRDSFRAADPGRTAIGPGARFHECHAWGSIKNVNTSEAFRELDKAGALAAVALEVWEDIVSGRASVEPSALLRFFLLTFADLKRNTFMYWFAFPTLGTQDTFHLAAPPHPASSLLSRHELIAVGSGLSLLWAQAMKEPRGHGSSSCPPFFVVVLGGGGREEEARGGGASSTLGHREEVQVLSLAEYERGDVQGTGGLGGAHRVLFGFVDPSTKPGIPGWPLRNLLVLLSARWGLSRASVLCYRGLVPRPEEGDGRAHGEECFSEGDLLLEVRVGPRLPATKGNRRGVISTARPGVRAAKEEETWAGVGQGVGAEVEAIWLPARVGSLGWEPNTKGKPGPRRAHLSSLMNPRRLAQNSVRLNIKLMRWRALPELDVGLLERTKCLLLGAGTLGCAVARSLLGWGVEHITLVDNGRVSYSNPVRQSLYSFEDCLGGGKRKAPAAAAALSAVYPGARTEGHVLTIPMPGHPPATKAEEGEMRMHAEELERLVVSHDVVFVLTDSRESRWLPTLLSARHDKTCINVALGLDSYLVVRHGGAPPLTTPLPPGPVGGGGAELQVGGMAGREGEGAGHAGVEEGKTPAGEGVGEGGATPSLVQQQQQGEQQHRLGCYFCTDVVAPENSLLNRTLDQQCTVTRPGLAPMAAAASVELMVTLLHHPLRHKAAAENCAGERRGAGSAEGGMPLGALPHQLRYFLGSFTTVTPSALAFDRCTACSAAVVEAYAREGWSFVRHVCGSPQHLEEVSGLQDMRRWVGVPRASLRMMNRGSRFSACSGLCLPQGNGGHSVRGLDLCIWLPRDP
ncbi:unnamed protein product [Discosporangium mesarthrocarpum]